MRILIINPNVDNTQIAVYDSHKELFVYTIIHDSHELSDENPMSDQTPLRAKKILEVLLNNEISLDSIDIISTRGGLLKPLKDGVYEVNDLMIEELLMAKYGEDEANLGALIAFELINTCRHEIAAYVVNPSSVDEMQTVYKISGIPDIERHSKFHALNHKSVAKNYARSLGKKYEDINLIVAHMGLGTTIGAHSKGKVIDVNNGLDGDGPFSAERTGSLPIKKLADLCFSGKYSKKEVLEMISNEGGLYSYFHTRNAKEIENMVIEGDSKVELIYTAMAYQVSKEIGSMAAVLKGNVDAILLTGGLSYSEMLCNYIKEKVSYIAPVIVYPGEDELKELADAVIRALDGEESLFEYV